ncbi:histidinol phosphatase [Joostella atrarenae]|uniref:protein-tyrosine-phosphatase n=1 Tax=Joostella atrarenae TaxID=679257 RepID=A0ABS9J749_9FLAO|nr:CpsB/CapC family capsule biosynthesis tyrosine phosphatase [Joostella atrarenae]MCF8716267.1 histidinol phosphatase [Joostella atrarenae]
MTIIFKDKKRITDYLYDFTDIHSHLIPGIDDGSKNKINSYELIKELKDLGIRNLITTPHVISGLYPNTSKIINEELNSLKKYLVVQGMCPNSINAAAEYMVDENFESLIENNELLCIKDKYVLMELPQIKIPMNMATIFTKLKNRDYIPVLAHPERYNYFHNNYEILVRMKHQGWLFQLNALSLSDYYGNRVKNMGMKLLKENQINFLGTDIHNKNQIEKLKNISIKKNLQKNFESIVCNTNTVFLS